MTTQEESQLIQKAQQGDERAFEALVRLHYDRIYAMACSYCLNRDLAQDITQEVCLILARNIRSYHHNAAFLTWVYRITVNTAKNMAISTRRRQKNEHEYSREASEQYDTGIHEALSHRQELARIHNLPDPIRTAVLLVYIEGLSHKDAAKILGCAEVTISWRIFKARKLLQEHNL
jgi:RNA polymerase sigma-70 factor (ECF subfamily)